MPAETGVPALLSNHPTKLLEEVDLAFTWSAQAMGSIMEADFTVTNNSQTDIKDIEIRCDYFGKSQTRVDHAERVIFDVIPAKSSKVFPKFSMGFMSNQTNQAACKITIVTPARLT